MRKLWCDLIARRWVPIKARAHLYRLIGIPVGDGTGIQSDVFIAGDRLSIGSDCFINRFCRLDAVADLTICDNVFIGFGVTVITSTHGHGIPELRAGANHTLPVFIGRGSWIGTNVTILPGVTVGDGCVIAAGAVVTADTKPNTLYAGVPALPKRELS